MELERKEDDSIMLNVFQPGMWRRGMSMQIMLAPRTHAENYLASILEGFGENIALTYTAQHCHYPSPGIIV